MPDKTGDTYRTRINRETVRIMPTEGSLTRFAYLNGTHEQCEDCGRDELRLHRNRTGEVECLLCNHCETAYPLRKEDAS